jgi:DNA-binding transcriptional MocR family regulator
MLVPGAAMILIQLDRRSPAPLHVQIAEQIRNMIDAQTLRIGAQLPSTRTLAESAGVNRSTVLKAYQELWALGYIDSSQGSYTTVRARLRLADMSDPAAAGAIDWQTASSPWADAVYQRFLSYTPERGLGSDAVNLSQLGMDPRLFPVNEMRRCLNHVMTTKGRALLQYGDKQGDPELREVIAERARTHGMAVTADRVLVTNGSQQAIDLVLRLLAPPGRRIVIEEPTYANVIPLAQAHGLEIVGVEMTEEGLDLGQLEARIAESMPALVYTIPNFQNPTGLTTSQSHREALIGLCRRHGIPLVEDGFEEEMKYFGGVTLPIKSMDVDQVVVYLGTFSKVLFPGVRIGWVIADPECIRRLLAIKRFADLSSSPIVQGAMVRFCRLGLYDTHIRRMHKVFRRRMVAAQKAAREHLPRDLVSWTEPAGGYLIWVRFRRRGIDEEGFGRVCAQNGVVVSPGSYYFSSRPSDLCFRISISMLDESQVEEGMARLGRAIRALDGERCA